MESQETPAPSADLAQKLLLLANRLDQVLDEIRSQAGKSKHIEARLAAHEKKAKEKDTVVAVR